MSYYLSSIPEWRIFSGSLAGVRNISPQGSFQSQDSVRTFLRNHEKVVGVVMSDGASSAKYARHGAKSLVDGIVQRIFLNRSVSDTDTLSDMLNYKDHEIRDLIYDTSISVLKENLLALDMGEQSDLSVNDRLKEMASTLLCFFSDGRKYVAVNIGDGLICRCGEEDEYEIILSPENRLYRNQTYYITDDDALEHMNVVKGQFATGSTYALMTDGACDCLYSRQSQSLARLLFKFSKVLKSYDRRTANPIIFNAMKQLFPKRTEDDCALALLTCID